MAVASSPSMIEQAVALFHVRRFDDAAAACLAALQSSLDNFDAVHLLGAVRGKQGRLAEAVDLLARAVDLRPHSFDAHRNLGLANMRLGRHEAAIAAYLRAAALSRADAAPWRDLARAYRAAGREDDAAHSLRRALVLRPDDAELHNELGNALKALGRHADAAVSYRAAVARAPSVAAFHHNLGQALDAAGEADEALECFRRAALLRPDMAEAQNSLGNALGARQRLDEAMAAFRAAIAASPGYVYAHYNLGNVLKALNRHEEAIACFEQACTLDPAFADAHWNEALARLGMGDLRAGWRKYEWRWRRENSQLRKRNFNQPPWQGDTPLDGKTILLHAEQGLGDTIQFVRFVAAVARRGARVILEVQPVLLPLLAHVPGAERVIAYGDALPPFDLHCPLMSLPLALDIGPETIPAGVPYVQAPADMVARTRASLPHARGALRIGVAWQGNRAHRSDAQRSMALAQLAALLDLPGVQFVSLQKTLSEDEQRLIARLRSDFIHPGGDVAQTAALIQALDLVITVDTAWAHWAGAAGRPVWVMLAHSPDWRWMRHRADSPWYPTARLFRQPRPGAWPEVVQSLRRELAALVETRGSVDSGPPPTIEEAERSLGAGDLNAAAAVCRRLIDRDPEDFSALHLLGLVQGRQQLHHEAVATLGRAVAIGGGSAAALRDHAAALLKTGDTAAAMARFEAALALDPADRLALRGMADALCAVKRHAEAESFLVESTRAAPGDAGGWTALAALRMRLGRPKDAVAALREAIACRPDDSILRNDLGNALKADGDAEQAAAAYRAAIAIAPTVGEFHYNLALALSDLGRQEEVEACYRQALELKPDLAEAGNNLAVLLAARGEYDAALDLLRRAVAARPQYVEALNTLANTLLRLTKLEEAIEVYDRVLAIDPAHGAAWNQSLALLGAGRMPEGWVKYENRFRVVGKTLARRKFAAPAWNGQDDLSGKTVLLHAEQGLGDTIQFVRFAKLVAQRGARVVLEVQPVLKRLLARAPGVAKVAGRGERLPVYDYHCSLLSLPLALKTTLETLPTAQSYLHAPTDLAGVCERVLGHDDGRLRVGLAWRGSAANPADAQRSMALSQLMPHLALPGVRLISLQPELTEADRECVGVSAILQPGLDFESTAALVEGLDLVITVDTAWAHWAGACGRPTWVMLPFGPDWRWMRDRADSPWYPSLRLFRQRRPGDWVGVVADVRRALCDQITARRHLNSSESP